MFVFYQPHDAHFFPGAKNHTTQGLAVVCKSIFQKMLVDTILALKKQYLLQTELYSKRHNFFMSFGQNLNIFAVVNTYAIDFLGIDTG